MKQKIIDTVAAMEQWPDETKLWLYVKFSGRFDFDSIDDEPDVGIYVKMRDHDRLSLICPEEIHDYFRRDHFYLLKIHKTLWKQPDRSGLRYAKYVVVGDYFYDLTKKAIIKLPPLTLT